MVKLPLSSGEQQVVIRGSNPSWNLTETSNRQTHNQSAISGRLREGEKVRDYYVKLPNTWSQYLDQVSSNVAENW